MTSRSVQGRRCDDATVFVSTSCEKSIAETFLISQVPPMLRFAAEVAVAE